MMSARAENGVPVCAVDPNYLHSNSTSHTWPFSAIAELVDNAYDPDVNAKQLWINKTVIKGHDCLTFTDNGEGLDYDKMHKMLSFGFSDKKTVRNHVPVGLYGNGFKSGSMRLGKDAIVFSKKKDGSMCVGMLSQTYLREIEAQNVVVPIVSFRSAGDTVQPEAGHDASLRDILRYSLFHTVDELSSELHTINTQCSSDYEGTKIIIWNLRRTSADELELDFDTDRYDIRIPATEKETREHQSSPDIEFSLRAYCSILYLKPRMQINIRGQKVNTLLICKSLAHVAKDTYRPNFTRQTIKITLGYNTQNKDHYGVMMYHKNRLIKAYERVGCQRSADKKGVGVIAVIECNFIQPTHNKQNFLETDEYRKIIKNLSGKVETYWNAVRQKKGLKGSVPVEDQPKTPDQNWAQCDECQKWRKLPDGIDSKKLPEKWFCLLNPDPQYRDCSVEEEAEDSEDESPLLKDYKQKDRILKKRQDLGRNQTLLSSPFSPAQTLTRVQTPVTSTSPAPSASSSNMPVINSVYSLSTPKRKTRSSEQNTSVKRVRTRGSFFTSTQTSDDEVIVLDEIHSSPRPSESTHVKVQSEEPASDGESASHMEFSDHTSMNAETTGRADEMPSTSGIQTQTEHPIIIKEEEDHPNKKTLDGIENANEPRTSKQSPSEKQINQFSVNQPTANLNQVKEEDQTMLYTIQDVNSTHTSSSDTERLPQNRETDEQNYQALYQQAMEDNEKLRKEKDEMKKKEEESLKSYENLKKQRDELKKGEEELLKINENLQKERDEMKELLENILEQKAGHSSTSDHHDDVDHSDDLSRELCVRNVECDELKKKLSDLEKKHSQLQKDQEELSRRFTEASTRPDASDTEMNIRLTTTQHNDQVTPAKLRDLRSKVAQLLVKFVPVLDLNQINYDCDVIDEILGQVVEEVFATK